MALRAAEADEAAKVGRAPRPAAGPLAGLPEASSTERCVIVSEPRPWDPPLPDGRGSETKVAASFQPDLESRLDD